MDKNFCNSYVKGPKQMLQISLLSEGGVYGLVINEKIFSSIP